MKEDEHRFASLFLLLFGIIAYVTQYKVAGIMSSQQMLDPSSIINFSFTRHFIKGRCHPADPVCG